MLSDRSYMRDDYPRQKTSVLVWLISAITAGFILQVVFQSWFGAGGLLERGFGLSLVSFKEGRVWTLFTYGFLHNSTNFLHVVVNLLLVYFLGRELLPLLGARRFINLFLTAVAVGGLTWVATNWQHSGAATLLGSSAGVAAFLIVFACFYPNQQMTFLLFFFIPITLKPKYLAMTAVLVDLAGFLFYEVMGSHSPFAVAYSAQLGGMMVGWLYFRYVHDGNWTLRSRGRSVELPGWMRKKSQVATVAPAYRVNLSNRNDLRAEVDRILDKINSDGFGALTADEKRLLDEAKDSLSRR